VENAREDAVADDEVRLWVLSDLHFERGPLDLPEVDADVLILAGDIGLGTRGVEWAREWADGRPALYVAGNHEFYGHALPGLLDELRDTSAGSSVIVLENDEVVVNGIRFLGCTLWSDFDFDGAENRDRSMRICERVVNDYEYITFGPRTLAPRDTRTVHIASRRWLAARLDEPFDGTTVVITHHAPLIRGRPALRELRAIAGAFASDLTELMGEERVALWIYGHTHRAADIEVLGTRLVSNPRGYPRDPVEGFDPAGVIRLGSTYRNR
jgi:3',5'-cyclic AMP phosphodiesterase CpdA